MDEEGRGVNEGGRMIMKAKARVCLGLSDAGGGECRTSQ
jgi:hypothetical protein